MNEPTYRTTFGFVLVILGLIVISWVALLALSQSRW